jgi:glycosyltransferase involved in cell wall biosynthesis
MVKVSVCMITYNHEPFIAQAIESVLMQRTSFPYELVIGEDCSTDGTREIVRQYAEKHPDIIRPLFREQNLGMHRNFVDTLAHCRGEYVALLEGDDYWTDPYKLQKQAEFLDEHPEYVLVCGNALTIREDEGYRVLRVARNAPSSFDFGTRELMLENPCPTLTVMFRSGLVREFPDIYYKGSGGDRRLYLLLSEHGRCRYFNDVLGVYRIHSGGATQRRQSSYKGVLSNLRELIRNAEMWNEYFGGTYFVEVQRVRSMCAKRIVLLALRNRDIVSAIAYARWIDTGTLTRKSRLVVRVLQQIGKLLRVESPG